MSRRLDDRAETPEYASYLSRHLDDRSTSSAPSEQQQSSEQPRQGDDIQRLVDFIMRLREMERGGVAFNHLAGSLAPLPEACIRELSRRDTGCATIRYQIDSGATFGTLFAALCSDIHALRDRPDTAGTIGTFVPPAASQQWQPLAGIEPLLPTVPEGGNGEFDPKLLASMLGALSTMREKASPFIIFLEVYGSDGDDGAAPAWREAERAIFEALPPGLVLVISGVPEGYNIPDDAPWCLTINVIDPASASTTAPTTASRYTTPSLHSDRPTSLDMLGVKDKADALAGFVLHAETRPPLTIGIHGPWGKGKSSFMEMIETALFQLSKNVQWGAVGAHLEKMAGVRGDSPARSPRHPLPGGFPLSSRPTAMMGSWDEFIDEAIPDFRTARSFPSRVWWRLRLLRPLRGVRAEMRRRFITVHFNAWGFQDATQTWAGLAHVISEKLEGSLSWRQRLAMRVGYAWKYRRSEMVLDLIPVAAITLAAIVLLLIPDIRGSIVKGLDQGDPLGGLLKYILPGASVLALLWALAWRITKVAQPVSERVASYMKRPDHRTQMGYQHKVMEDLQFIHRRIRIYRPICRVIVFVDDLDRCSDEKIMEILRAVNLILANCNFFVFLGMDTEMIYRAVEAQYRGSGGNPPEGFAEHYLRKIVQISFHLPNALPKNLCELTSSLFSQRSRDALQQRSAGTTNGTSPPRDQPDGDRMPTTAALPFDMNTIHRAVAIEDVMDTADELAAFHDFQEFLSDNPREIKRLVNVHRLVKILMQSPTDTWPVERQQQLVKWVIFCSLWPDLVDDAVNVAENALNLTDMAPENLAKLRTSYGMSPDEITRIVARIQRTDTIALLASDEVPIHGMLGLPRLASDIRKQLEEFAGIGAPLPARACSRLTLAAQMSQMLHIPQR
jgi:hypothetical protein